MSWTLIVLFLFTTGVTSLTVPGFHDGNTCALAGERVQQIKERGLTVRYQCIPAARKESP